MGLRIGDAPAGGQRQIKVAVLVAGSDLAGREGLAGADGDANCARELPPIFGGLGVGVAPGADVGEDLLIGALVIAGNASPRSDGSAKTAGKIARLAFVALLAREASGRSIIDVECGYYRNSRGWPINAQARRR